MGELWRIRKAEPEDAAGLQNCMEAAYSVYQDRMGGKRLPPMDLDYAQEINQYPTWVVDFDGRIGGGLIMIFENSFALIANIAVHPEHQGQRIGGSLMRLAEAEAKDRDYAELRLATHPRLIENIALYKHLGWTEFDRGSEKVRMKKEILR